MTHRPETTTPPRRPIAFLNPDSLGDLVLRLPLFSCVAAEGRDIVLVVRSHLVSWAERLVPDAVIVPLPADPYDPVGEPEAFHVAQVVDELRSLDAEMVVLAAFQRTRFDECVVDALTGIERIGFAGDRYPAGTPQAQDPGWTDERLSRSVIVNADEHEWLKNRRLAEAIVDHPVAWTQPHVAATPRELDEAGRLLAARGISWNAFHVACPGASDRVASRSWPAERWIAVLRHASHVHGWRFVLVGTPDECESHARIATAVGRDAAMFIDGSLDPGILIGLLARSAGYVGRDSGPMHLAAALDRPVLCVTGGGTWPRFVPLAPTGAIFSLEVPCAGCGWFCHLDESYCVTHVPVEPVLAAVDELAGGALADVAVRPLPRSGHLAQRMERAAAVAGRGQVWTLQQQARAITRTGDATATERGPSRPCIFLGMPFYGAGNIGDDLALAGFLEAWRRLGSPGRLVAAIPFPRGSQTRRFPEIEWLADAPDGREAAIRDCDAWLALGGAPFQSDCGPWMLDLLAHDTAACERRGTPMFFLGTGVNDRRALDDPRARAALARAAHLWIRDADCAAWTAAVADPDRVTATADCAHIFLAGLTHPTPESQRLGWAIAFEDESLCVPAAIEQTLVQLREQRHDWLVQDVRWLPGGERWQHRRLAAEARNLLRLRLPNYDAATAADLLAAWPVGETLVSSRYHALLVGAWRGSRLVAVNRNDKLTVAASSLDCLLIDRVTDATELCAALDAARPVDRRWLAALADAAFGACREFAAHLRKFSTARPPRTDGIVDFDATLSGYGWHEPEHDAISSFRWMGDRRTAWVDVTVPATGANRLHCDIGHVAADGIEHDVQLLAAGVPLETRLARHEAGWTIEADLPPLAAGSVVRVEFLARHAIRPCELDAAIPDPRWLAIAVRRLRLE